MRAMKSILATCLVALLAFSPPLAIAAKVTPGDSCKKVGQKQVYKKKVYKCIKLGKRLYWNNGKSILPSPFPSISSTVSQTPSPSPSPTSTKVLETFSFIYRHTLVNGGGDNDEMIRTTIDSTNRVISRKVILKAGYQNYHDYLDGILLLSATRDGDFFYIRDNGDQIKLNFKSDSSVVGDDRRTWRGVKFNAKSEEVIFWDLEHDIYLLKNISSPNVTWSRVVEGNKLKTKFEEMGLDKSKEWLDSFVVLNPNKILFATSNNSTKFVNIWILEFSGSGDFALRKLSSFTYADWSSSLEFAISPDRKLVAYKYQASGLTPNFRVVLMDTSTYSATTLDTSRHYEGYIGPITFAGNNNLLMIPALVWSSDRDGGRVICRIDLRQSAPCSNMPGISGIDVIGVG